MTLGVSMFSCSLEDHVPGNADLQKESDAVKKQISVSYRDALASSTEGDVAAQFTSDGVVMGPGSPTAEGTAQLTSAYQGIFSAVGLDLNFKIDEIIVGSQYAFARSTSAGTVTVKANGATAPEENRELFVLKKENSQWKIARYIYNKMGTLNQAQTTATIENKSAASTDADKLAINSLVTSTYANAVTASDPAAVSAAFTTDGVLMAPDSPTAIGSAVIKDVYTSVFSAIKLNLTFNIDEIVIDGEYGYVRSHSSGTMLINANGQTVPASYREIFVVKKVNGNWKIAWYEYNQPM